jgi:uncharacterized protein YaiL (DUF2058 family)
VPAEAAARIRERDERSIMNLPGATPVKADENDPYGAFQVPDDLMW